MKKATGFSLLVFSLTLGGAGVLFCQQDVGAEEKNLPILIDPRGYGKGQDARPISPIVPIKPVLPVLPDKDRTNNNEGLTGWPRGEVKEKTPRFENVQVPRNLEMGTGNSLLEYLTKRELYRKKIEKEIMEEMQLETDNMILPKEILEAQQGFVDSNAGDIFFMNDTSIFDKNDQFASRVEKDMKNWEKRNPIPEEIKFIEKRFNEMRQQMNSKENQKFFEEKARKLLEKTGNGSGNGLG